MMIRTITAGGALAQKQCPNGHDVCDPHATFCQECGALLADIVYRPRRQRRRRRRLRWRVVGWVAVGFVVILIAVAAAVSTLGRGGDLLPASEALRRWVSTPTVEEIRQAH